MSKNNKAKNKRDRRELAVKRAKKKKIIIIISAASIVLLIAAYFVISAILASGTLVFSDGIQSVNFREDGNFIANLTHGVRMNGTYFFVEEDRRTVVNLSLGGVGDFISAEIVDDNLIVPEEWRDLCGHNWILPKRR